MVLDGTSLVVHKVDSYYIGKFQQQGLFPEIMTRLYKWLTKQIKQEDFGLHFDKTFKIDLTH